MKFGKQRFMKYFLITTLHNLQNQVVKIKHKKKKKVQLPEVLNMNKNKGKNKTKSKIKFQIMNNLKKKMFFLVAKKNHTQRKMISKNNIQKKV